MSFVLAQLTVDHSIEVVGYDLKWADECSMGQWWKGESGLACFRPAGAIVMGPFYFSCDFWLNYVIGRFKFLGLKLCQAKPLFIFFFRNFHVMGRVCYLG
jgi:hypothetical protein